MKSKLFQMMVVVAIAAASTVTVNAQDNAKAGQVVLLDVAKVFRVNLDFESKMAAIKSEANSLKTEIEGKQNGIRDRAAKVGQNYEVGTPERNKMEAQLEQEQAGLRTYARQKETDLLQREAQIYYTTYNKMKGVVSAFAQENGISLVLRFDSGEINPENRAEVVNGVNRSVVFHHYRDITKYIVGQMGPMTKKAVAEAAQQTQKK